MIKVSDKVDLVQARGIVQNLQTEARFAFVRMIRIHLDKSESTKTVSWSTVLQAFVEYVEEHQRACLEWLKEDSEIEVTAAFWARLKGGVIQPSEEQCKLLLISFHNALCRPGDHVKPMKLPIRLPHRKVLYWKTDGDTARGTMIEDLELSKREYSKLFELRLHSINTVVVLEDDVNNRPWSYTISDLVGHDEDLQEALYVALKAARYKPVYISNDND